jgi:hypothetical protein
MSKTSTNTVAISADTEANLNHLCDLRSIGAVNEANPLILGVEAKADACQPLSTREYGILWNAVTEDTLAFMKQHPELLN